MSTDIANRRRTAAGTPAGGQFATEARTEPEVDLSAPGRRDRYAYDQGLDPRQMLHQARSSARQALSRLAAVHPGIAADIRANVDDVAATVVADALAARNSKHANGHDDFVITAPYLHAIANIHVKGLARGILSPPDRKAIGIFNARVAETETASGRPMTFAERAELAEDIREQWPHPRHRPSPDFVHLAAIRVEVFSTPVGDQDLGDTIADRPHGQEPEAALEPGSPGARVLAMPRRSARRHAWTAIAELYGAPDPARITRTRAESSARTLAQVEGGAARVAELWLQGDMDDGDERVSALFAPWSAADAGARQTCAEVLVRHRAYADELHASARSLALAESTPEEDEAPDFDW